MARLPAWAAALAALALLPGCTQPATVPATTAPAAADAAADDVVVVAVVDSGFNPYHFDFLASLMPQAANNDPADDLPLDRDPSTWVPGYPPAGSFASYGPLELSLSSDPDARSDALHQQDAKAWDSVRTSSKDAVHLRWIPGTKVIGAVTFNRGGDGYAAGSHGVGTSSVSVGNLHGSCPHCLLVFVDGTQEQANEWVAAQDWIDLQTNSWGYSTTLVLRDRVYAHSDTEAQRAAVERGQGIFFSAGNGVDGGFTVTNPTLFSSQEGPDWITTVGAILPDGSTTGAGRPVDVSAPGDAYRSAYGSRTVNGTGLFGGTSNATPVTAGLYAEALHQLRKALPGPSRMQKGGTIAQGPAEGISGCGAANPACALADGALTVHELREALFRSANHTGQGYAASNPATGDPQAIPQSSNARENTFLGAGHGSFWGRMHGEAQYQAEVGRIVGYATGAWHAGQDPDQAAWFVADSLCRQAGWGAWEHGYASGGQAAPPADPEWPVRAWLASACPQFLGPLVAAERLVPFPFDLLP